MDNDGINTQLAYDAREELQARPPEPKQEPVPQPPPPASGTESPPLSTDDVDQLLLAGKRIIRNRSRKACYPCAKRKIRCDRDERQPCSNCRKQPHPNLCGFEPDEPRRFTKKRSSPPPPPRNYNAYHQDHPPPSGAIPPPVATNSSPAYGTPQTNQRYDGYQPYSGGSPYAQSSAEPPSKRARMSSPPPMYRQQGGYPSQAPASAYGYGPSLGSPLNASSRPVSDPSRVPLAANNLPFVPGVTSPDLQWQQLQAILPAHKDVHRFSNTYKSFSHPLNPVIFDFDSLESGLCNYLEDLGADRLRSQLLSGEKRKAEYAMSWIALLLSTLAYGAQLSEEPPEQRFALSQEYVRRAMVLLRLANYLLRPFDDSVQTLLIISNVLQNDGQLSAAHALTGTAIRLAQTKFLHLHALKNTTGDNNAGLESRKKWWIVVLQDSLSSLAFGRPASVSIQKDQEPPLDRLWRENGLSYNSCMFSLAKHTIRVLQGFPDQVQARVTLQDVDSLAALRDKAEPHLRSKPNCRSMTDRMQYYAFQIYSSITVAYTCIAALREGKENITFETSNVQQSSLYHRLKTSLAETIQGFVDLASFGEIPLRSWVMMQSALSAAVLLAITGETIEQREKRDMLSSFLNILSRADMGEGKIREEASFRLSRRHARAFDVLNRICGDNKGDAWADEAASADNHASSNGGFTPVPGYHRYGEPNGSVLIDLVLNNQTLIDILVPPIT